MDDLKGWHKFSTEYFDSETKSYTIKTRLFHFNLDINNIDISVDWRFKEVKGLKNLIIRKQSVYLGIN